MLVFLPDGMDYTVRRKSAKIVVGAPGQPGTPTRTRPASGSLRVAFTGPFDNGSKITQFIVACTSGNGGVARTQAGSTHAIVVKGLTAGKTYTCTAKAKNSRGIGPTSHPSKAAKA